MKSHRIPRLARKTGFVCLALAALLSALLASSSTRAVAGVSPDRPRAHDLDSLDRTPLSSAALGKYPSAPLVLDDGGPGAGLLAFPPRRVAGSHGEAGSPLAPRAPLAVVYLHGVHGLPQNGCPWLRDGASEIGWLLCPRANERLSNGTYSWGGTIADQRAVVARAERVAHARGVTPGTAGVIVGFSQGAYVALDLVRARLGRYRGLVLIGASVEPSRAELGAAGVDRIVLAAGDLDAAAGPMRRAAERLRREGAHVRFVSLGAIGHSYETPHREALADAIAWAGSST